MINFLNRIRQGLLAENKFTKYLLYASGEIVLVVIGILIALSINNWNQNRLLQREATGYYNNIKRQLQEDSGVLKSNIDFNQHYFKQYQRAIELIENNDRNHLDSLAIIAINLLEYSDFHQETNPYQTLVNSGEIKIINNHKIVEGLQRLEEIYIYINKLENGHFEIIKLVYPELNKIIRLYSAKIENESPIFTFEFQNYFFITSEIMKEKDEIYNKAITEINTILEMIDKQLQE